LNNDSVLNIIYIDLKTEQGFCIQLNYFGWWANDNFDTIFPEHKTVADMNSLLGRWEGRGCTLRLVSTNFSLACSNQHALFQLLFPREMDHSLFP